jgi:hypothetical protein
LNCEPGASAFSRAHRLGIRNAACLVMLTAIYDTIDFTGIVIKMIVIIAFEYNTNSRITRSNTIWNITQCLMRATILNAVLLAQIAKKVITIFATACRTDACRT